MFTEDISNTELPIDIVSNLRQHLTEQEIEWVSTVSASVDTEDIALFAKLVLELNGWFTVVVCIKVVMPFPW